MRMKGHPDRHFALVVFELSHRIVSQNSVLAAVQNSNVVDDVEDERMSMSCRCRAPGA